MAPVCVVLSLGISGENSGPRLGLGVPLGLVLDLGLVLVNNFVIKCTRKLFCKLLEHLWCFLDGFW